MQRFFRARAGRKHDPPVVRGIFFILFVIPMSFGVPAAASLPVGNDLAARLSGTIVDDVSGSAVPGATVRLEPAGFIAYSAEDGSFVFRAVPPGRYVVQVRSVGYERSPEMMVELNADQSSRIEIRLTPTVYDLGSISIEGTRRPPSADRPIVIDKQAIRTSRATELADVLEKVNGVFVQKAGGSGPVEVRMRGSSASQVLVLVDGQKLNASGSGVADLSAIPVEVVERIEVHTGGASAEFGPEALGGAINIVTRPHSPEGERSFELSSRSGSYGAREGAVQLSNPIGLSHVTSRFSYSHRETTGDFDYAYTVQGTDGQTSSVEGTRRNNDLNANNYFASGLAELGSDIALSYSLHSYRTRRGLPSSVSRPDTSGRALDDRLIGTAALTYGDSPSSHHELTFGFTRLDQTFRNVDPALSPAYHFDARFLNELLSVKQSSQRALWRGNQARGVFEWRRDRLYHDDYLRPHFAMGRSTRFSRAAAFLVSQRFPLTGLKLFDLLVVEGAIRYDFAETQAGYMTLLDQGESHATESWSPRFGAVLSRGSDVRYTFRGSYGKSLRLPSMNALFWRGDARSTGNPDLRPEHSEHSEVFLDVAGVWKMFGLSASAGYFHSDVIDLVVWTLNFQNQWQPRNLGHARITGHEESVELTMFEGRLRTSWHNAVTDAFNEAPGHGTQNKRLVFYPRYISRLVVEGRAGIVSLSYAIRWSDRTYTNDANTKFYDGYRVDDLTVGVEKQVGAGWLLGGSAQIENVRDEDYVLLASYPMPGRSVAAAIRLVYRPK